jgi:thioester reductase-like protein
MSQTKSHILLTGVTGFLGKVVLEQLMARRTELSIDRVSVLIRPQRQRNGTVMSPQERFEKLRNAQLFSRLEPKWEHRVDVVAAELDRPNCGLEPASWERLTRKVTHVIHCAASVEFDLPLKEAAASNITAALEVLAFAGACPLLERMADVSTAYVTVWREGALPEELFHLPRPAEELYAQIQASPGDPRELLEETGHPNTYTYTKCLAEHLLNQRRGTVPLTIVRPSIISAAWGGPLPGWVDSPAALAGCLLYTGVGVIKAFRGNPGSRLDVVPVDVVAHHVLGAAFDASAPKAHELVRIRHCTMGTERALRLDLCADSTTRFFAARPGVKSRPGIFLGTAEHGFRRADFFRRTLPTQLKRAVLFALRRGSDRRRLERADERVRYMNSVFDYFMKHTFDFTCATPVVAEGFRPDRYLDLVNRGRTATSWSATRPTSRSPAKPMMTLWTTSRGYARRRREPGPCAPWPSRCGRFYGAARPR